MRVLCTLLMLTSLAANAQTDAKPASGSKKYEIAVSLDTALRGPYSGVLRVYTQKDTSRDFGGEHSLAEPAFSIEVKNWRPGESKLIDERARMQVGRFVDVTPGYYKMIAILDTNTTERGNNAPGNLYSPREGMLHVTSSGASGSLILSRSFRQRPFPVSDSVKEVVIGSPLLSAFRKTAIYHKAGVFLPASYFTDTKKEFPVVFIIPGWGGTHQQAANPGARKLYGVGLGSDKIYVFLNPETQTPYGLHAYVDSRVNGPWGTAFIKELMPYIQQNFRGSKDPHLNFIMGQSSGGYGGLWLALHFPSSFGGAWLTAPDPVDFSNFVGINIYTDKNALKDADGNDRGFMLNKGKYMSTQREVRIKEFFDGDGGQMQSFDAEFGIPGKDGRPRSLFDTSGVIHKNIAETWKPYDLSLYVKANAAKLKKEMIGPFKIYAGTLDNFLLDKSLEAFAEKIKPSGLNIHPVFIVGADHFTTRSEKLAAEIAMEMEELIRSSR